MTYIPHYHLFVRIQRPHYPPLEVISWNYFEQLPEDFTLEQVQHITLAYERGYYNGTTLDPWTTLYPHTPIIYTPTGEHIPTTLPYAISARSTRNPHRTWFLTAHTDLADRIRSTP